MSWADNAGNAAAGPSTSPRRERNGMSPQALEQRQAVQQGSPSQSPASQHAFSRSHDRFNGTGVRTGAAAQSSPSKPPSAPPPPTPSVYPEPPFLVRARYDFTATDVSALSFVSGDLIEVITMLESGWWDGIMGSGRGWFPSNFVEVVSEEEMEALEAAEAAAETETAAQAAHQETSPVGTQAEAEAEPAPGPARPAGDRRRTVMAEEILGVDDALGTTWDGGTDGLEDLARSMGVGAGAGSAAGEVIDLGDDGEDEFALAARRHRQRADTISSTTAAPTRPNRSPGRVGQTTTQGLLLEGDENEDEEDFGAALQGAASRRREREHTAGTIRAAPAATAVPTMGTPISVGRAAGAGDGRDTTPLARGRVRDSGESSVRSEASLGQGNDDAWIPCLTPDGQVYYHNTQTGEDSWDLPISASDDMYDEHEDDADFYPTPSTAPSSSTVPAQPAVPDPADEFRPPPKVNGEIPYPWTSRMSDDGSRWYYFNQLTGETSATLPLAPGRGQAGKANGVAADLAQGVKGIVLDGPGGTVPPPIRPRRLSANVRARAITDWDRRSRHKIEVATRPPGKSSLGIMLEIINDALRDVFEAAVAGSAAEEEMSRASDLALYSAHLAAEQREDSAVNSLLTAHRELLAAITDLIRAFGYVGPLDKTDDMPRPAWTGDMTLIGSVGVFSANVHAATRSKRTPENGLSVWSEVLRSGSKLRDVITDFPELATEGKVLGRPLWAWVGLEPVGVLCKGRWGFGKTTSPVSASASGETEPKRPLGHETVKEAERVRAELLSLSAARAEQSEGAELQLLGLASQMLKIVLGVDIAIAIDIDGEVPESKATEDDVRFYDDLVDQARTGLRDLVESTNEMERLHAEVYLALADGPTPADPAIIEVRIQALLGACTTSSRGLSNLSMISAEQRALILENGITGKFGVRSPRYTPPSKARPLSTISHGSKASHGSRASAVEAKRTKVRGIEDDFEDSEERLDRNALETESDRRGAGREVPSLQKVHRASRDSTSASMSPVSASASQVSLARQTSAIAGPSKQQQQQQQNHLSATSSVTSLAYQRTDKTESDGGSIKGNNRASNLMKGFFNRARSDSDQESRDKARNQKGAKKLAKLLGEDVIHHPQFANPRPLQQPQPQMYHPQQQASVHGHGGVHDDLRTPPSASFGQISPALAVAETPWYLAEDYAPEEIVFDEKGGVRAGTLKALVARLTPHGSTDTTFFQAFMLTFRAFTSGDRVLELLVQRYLIQPPAGMDPIQETDWVRLKQTPIRLRVANVLRAWLDVHYLPEQDEATLPKIEHFASVTMIDSIGSEMLSMLSKTLLNLIARRRRGEDLSQRRIVSGVTLSPPAPLVPRTSGKQLQLTDIAPLELARQLTIIEFGNFQKVQMAECLHKLWTDEDETKARNVRAVIHTANKLAAWIGLLVLQPKDPKSRGTLMKYFVQTAAELRNLNNLSSMAAVIAGLNAAPIDRLKRSKEYLSPKTLATKVELDKIMDSSKNFANYKDMLRTVNPPCVPFLGFYLSALIFIEDGNKDIWDPAAAKARGMTNSASSSSLSSSVQGHNSIRGSGALGSARTGLQPMTSTSATSDLTESSPSGSANTAQSPKEPLLNFFKRSLTAEVLRDIQQYQSQPYNLAKCRPVLEFLMTGLERVETGGDLYERSLQLEPREREEERITRMLHDSGFI